MRYLPILCLIVLLFASCRREPIYPTLLTEADSAYVRGDYVAADSMLAEFDKQGSLRHNRRGEENTAYRQYLGLTSKFVRDQLTDQDFSLADSLVRLYNKRGTREKHARSLLFLGDIYRYSGDNPSALNCYQKAEKTGIKINSNILQLWASKCIGDIYFEQRMFDDCKSYYLQYYQLSCVCIDTLRMVHGAQRMGKFYTIENNVDSTLYYYQLGIALAHLSPQAKSLLPPLKANLADIYIQIEEYEEAAQLMEKDSVNMFNWAYWYYGQSMTDSAIYYFRKSANLYNLQVRTECLGMLALLYAGKGDYKESNRYYAQLTLASDSLRTYSQTEETRRVNAQYNYNSLKRERDELAKKQQQGAVLFICVVLLVLLTIPVVIVAAKRYRQRKDSELLRERLLRQEEENRHKNSIEQIEENKRRIETLERDLSKAQQLNDELEAKRLRDRAELLALKNEQIKNNHRQEELKLEEFAKTELYRKLKPANGDTPARLTEADWLQLGHYIDDIYNNFTSRLTAMAKLSGSDLKLCYLVKLDISPSDMSSLLFLTKGAISLARRRMWKKLKGEEGTSAQLDAFIKAF